MAGYRRGLRLRGSVVVVTGAATPIGRATALALARRGARPVLLDAPGAGLDAAVTACRALEGASTALPVDVTEATAVQAAVRGVSVRCGGLDGWVQCAPVPAPSGGLLDLPPAQVRHAFDVAVLGAVHGARAAVDAMATRGGGVLVLVVSVYGQVARPYAAPQAMASAALRAMAGALRQELRLAGVRGVAVTTVLAPDVDAAAAGSPRRTAGDRDEPSTSPERVAATVLSRLRHPGLEKVAGGPLVTALVHGHALVPPLTEWLVARTAGRPGGG